MASTKPTVQGIADVNQALARAGLTLKKQKLEVLKVAAEPVRSSAEVLAVANIQRIGFRWSRMRIGVGKRAVWVAPKARSSKRLLARRPNLAGKLLLESMIPAVEANEHHVVARLNELLVKIEREFDGS